MTAICDKIFPKKESAKTLLSSSIPSSLIDGDLILVNKLKSLSLHLFQQGQIESCNVKSTHQKVISYSFLGRTTDVRLSSVLKLDAVDEIHQFITEELKKRQKTDTRYFNDRKGYLDASVKWNQFYQRVKTNTAYMEFSSNAVTRKSEYLEISNLIYYAIQSTQKLSAELKGEICASLPLIICEDIDKCKTGLLSRIHHNILPFCMQEKGVYQLHFFALKVIHAVKNHLVQRTLEEACNGQIDVHYRNAFIQLMQKTEGLGLTQQELLKPEALTNLLLQSGSTHGTLPYWPIYQKNKNIFYSPDYLIQETILFYSQLSEEEKELLGFDLMSWCDWRLSVFEDIYDLLDKIRQEALLQPEPNKQYLIDAARDVLDSIYIPCPLNQLPMRHEFVRLATKNLIRDLFINEENGQLSRFGAILVLQTTGLFEIEKKPESLKYQLLDQIGSKVDLHRILEEQLEQKKICFDQIPENLIEKNLENLRHHPHWILNLNRDQVIDLIAHIEELCLLVLRVVPFDAFDDYTSWPLVFKFNRQAVLGRLTQKDPLKRIRVQDIETKIIDLDFLIVLLNTTSNFLPPNQFWKIVPKELYQNLEFIHVLTEFPLFLKGAPPCILKNQRLARHAYEKNSLALKFFDLSPFEMSRLRIEKHAYHLLIKGEYHFADWAIPKIDKGSKMMKSTTILALVYRFLFSGPFRPLSLLEKGIYTITISTILLKKGLQKMYPRRQNAAIC